MSLSTWFASYYQKPADCATNTAGEAAKHSLTKWLGMDETSLSVCGIERKGTLLLDGKTWIQISSENCALCCWMTEHHDTDEECCNCPYFLANGSNCHRDFEHWRKTGDTGPMVLGLQAAVEYCEKMIYESDKQISGL